VSVSDIVCVAVTGSVAISKLLNGNVIATSEAAVNRPCASTVNTPTFDSAF
jgi:hypothetical protein